MTHPTPNCSGTPVYDRDYFIRKFEGIPDEKWCVGRYENGAAHCAFGHCGVRTFREGRTDEAEALDHLLHGRVSLINDGLMENRPELSPKARILAALADLKP